MGPAEPSLDEPSSPTDVLPLRPDAPQLCGVHLSPGQRVGFQLVDLRGRDVGFVDAIIPVAQRALAGVGLVPVFVTDQLDLAVFRRHRAIVEVLPSPARLWALRPELETRRRGELRLRAVERKWAAVGLVRPGEEDPGPDGGP